jgi:hypothetical protein
MSSRSIIFQKLEKKVFTPTLISAISYKPKGIRIAIEIIREITWSESLASNSWEFLLTATISAMNAIMKQMNKNSCILKNFHA